MTIILVAVSILMVGCVPSKKLRKGQYLLVSNEIQIDKSYKKQINKDALQSYVQQQPNSKFLFFFPANLWIDAWAKEGKQNKFKQWVKRNFSSPPSIYDQYMTENSVEYISRYLGNIGYFHSEITTHSNINAKKGTIKVSYDIKPSHPYTLNKLYYKIPDTSIYELIISDKKNCLIKEGIKYDYYSLVEERNRLTALLRSKGYYEFNQDFIIYEVDSSYNDHKLDVYLNIKDRFRGADSSKSIILPHTVYFMNNIYIYPWSYDISDTTKFDTTQYIVRGFKDRSKLTYYNFITKGKPKVRNKVVANAIAYNSMELFNYNLSATTKKNFNDIPIFRSVSMSFNPKPKDSMFTVRQGAGLLDCTVHLSQAPLNSVGLGFDLTNSSGDLGIKARAYWENKNIFKGAEVLNISLNTNLQAQKVNNAGIDKETQKFLQVFNTIDVGIKATLMFPRFFFPINMQRLDKRFRPITDVSVGVNYQKRQYYERWIATATFGYKWKATSTMEHYLNPAEISAVNINASDSMKIYISEISKVDKRLEYQYTNHLLAALHYTFIYNNQQLGQNKNYTYFKADFETSGNLIQVVNLAMGIKNNPEGYRTIFGIRYAEYARFNFDARRCWYIGKSNAIAGRALFGIGIPYGNSSALPYEKAFFAGGANGMRGWQYRYLGPGGYDGSTAGAKLERLGDMQIEFNLEWRFPIYSYLKGALFADLGNIWLLKKDANYPNGNFKWNSFYKQLAFDFGVGLRLDIGFIIIRLDAGIPTYDPGKVTDKWRINNMKFKDVVWNFAIGYPF